MGKCIIKLDDYYLEWSTVVDAPVTYGMTLDQLREHIRDLDGRNGLDALPERLARVEATGTSMHNDTLDGLLSTNRAGADETCLTREQIHDFYCVRSGSGERPRGAKWEDEDDE